MPKALPPPEPARIGPLTPKQESVALSIAGGATLDRAARDNKVGLTTVKTWIAGVPAFSDRVNELRAEMSARVLARVTSGMVVGIETLERLATKGKTETTQLRAAEALIVHGTTLTEVTHLKDRIAALEGATDGEAE